MAAGAGGGFRATFGTISITMSLVDRITGKLMRIGTGVMNMNNKLMRVSSYGFQAARAAGTAFAGMLMMAVQGVQSMYQSVEPLIVNVAKLEAVTANAGQTLRGIQFEEWADRAEKFGNQVGVSSIEMANALWQVASAGADTEEKMTKVATTAGKLGTIFGVETRQSVDILMSTLKGFGMSLMDVDKVAGTLNRAISESMLTMQDFGKTMSYVAPVAGAMELSLADVTTAIEAMAEAGISGSKAGTALRTTITRLASPTAEAQEWIDRLNLSFFEAGSKAEEAKEAWKDNMDTLDDLRDEIKDTEGAIDSLADKQSEYSLQARKISHTVAAVRLKAQKQDRDLTEEEMRRIDKLQEQRDILRWQAEDTAIAQAEQQEKLEDLEEQESSAESQAKKNRARYDELKGAMKPITVIAEEMAAAIKEQGLNAKQTMTFIETLIGRRGLSGFLAVMNKTKTGLDLGTASTAQFSEQLATSSKDLSEIREGLRKTDLNVRGLGKSWSAYEEAAEPVLAQNREQNRLIGERYDRIMDNVEAFKEMISQLTDMKLMMDDVTMGILDMIDRFGGLKKSIKGIAALIGIGIFGPMVMMGGQLLMMLPGLISGFMALSMTMQIGLLGAIGAIIVAVVLILKHFGLLDDVIQAIKGAFNTFIEVIKMLWHWLVGGSLVPAIRSVIDIFKKLFAPVQKVIGFFGDLAGAITNRLQGALNWIERNWKDVLISVIFPPVGMAKLINRLFPGLIDDIIEIFKDLPGDIKDLAKKIPEKIWEGIKSMAGWLKDKIGGIASSIVDKLNPMNWSWPFSPPSGVGVKMMEEIGKGIEAQRLPTLNIATRAGEDIRRGMVRGVGPIAPNAPALLERGAPRVRVIEESPSIEIQVTTGDIKEEADEDRLSRKIGSETKRALLLRGH